MALLEENGIGSAMHITIALFLTESIAHDLIPAHRNINKSTKVISA